MYQLTLVNLKWTAPLALGPSANKIRPAARVHTNTRTLISPLFAYRSIQVSPSCPFRQYPTLLWPPSSFSHWSMMVTLAHLPNYGQIWPMNERPQLRLNGDGIASFRTNKKGTSRLGTGDGSLDVLAQGAGWCLQSTQLQTTDAPLPLQ